MFDYITCSCSSDKTISLVLPASWGIWGWIVMDKSVITAALLVEINGVCVGFTQIRKEREATLTQSSDFCLFS